MLNECCFCNYSVLTASNQISLGFCSAYNTAWCAQNHQLQFASTRIIIPSPCIQSQQHPCAQIRLTYPKLKTQPKEQRELTFTFFLTFICRTSCDLLVVDTSLIFITPECDLPIFFVILAILTGKTDQCDSHAYRCKEQDGVLSGLLLMLRLNIDMLEGPLLEMTHTIMREAEQLPDLCAAELLQQLLLVRGLLQLLLLMSIHAGKRAAVGLG